MSVGENNFRSNYYHKLGSKSAVEEKKNLTRLLNIVPLDLRKLEQFCHHLHVPNDFRCELWKVLLKISPIYPMTKQYVTDQRREHFEELHRVAMAMKISSTETEEDIIEMNNHVIMYLVEHRTYILDVETMFELENAKLFSGIFNAVRRLDFNPCDTYWISRNFANLVQEKIHPVIKELKEKALTYLMKEDVGGKLSQHLQSVGAFERIPYIDWFRTGFSNLLPETTFERVWDQVIAGSTVVLAYIAVAILMINKRPIMVMTTPTEVLKIINELRPDTADEVVRRGIELWQRNGGKLTPSSTRASPAVNSERSPTPTSVHISH